jgi:flagellar hook assembly protein FlgD
LLCPADPNPFTGETHLRFELAAAADVKLAIYDPAGRVVRTLLSGERQAGRHVAVWDGRDEQARSVAPGLYFYRLEADHRVTGGKVILTR